MTLDTTRRDRLGVYGNPDGLTPNLDRIARRGVTFLDARAQVPLTLPSHVSVLTGMRVQHHGVRENAYFSVAPTIDTLAEVLLGHGYRTAAFVSAFVLERRFGLAQGFEVYDEQMTQGGPRSWQGHEVEHFERSGAETVSAALSWLDQSVDGGPFFLWVHQYDTHAPYSPPEPFAGRHEDPYDGEVAAADAAFGDLMRAIDRRPERVVTAVVSDHGESFGEHGFEGHGDHLYEEAMRIGMFIDVPDARFANPMPEQRVEIADLAATLLDLVGISNELPGRSLRPFWEKAHAQERSVVYLETVLASIHTGGSPVHALLEGPWKLIAYPKDERLVLFDLHRDPEELRDIAPDRPARAREMWTRLKRIIVEANEGNKPTRGVKVNGEMESKLRALGYITD